jgi:hypothetical protein
MRLIKSSLLLFLLIPSLLHARIGEKMEEIQKRHGAGKEVGMNQLIFTIDEYDVTITFEKGHSVMEIYTPHLGNDQVVRSFKREEIQKLLELQGGPVSWLKTDEATDEKTMWLSADGRLFARHIAKYNTITFAPSLKELPKS